MRRHPPLRGRRDREDALRAGPRRLARAALLAACACASPDRQPAAAAEPAPEPPARTAGADVVATGRRVFHQRCLFCHGANAVGIGIAPDLRRSAPGTHAAWDAIVRDGARAPLGMPGFRGLLRQDEIDAVHAYVIERAWATVGGRRAVG